MATVELNTREARLIGVLRAIEQLAKPELIDVSDLGDVIVALEEVVDIAQLEQALSQSELKNFIRGFITGMGATRLAPPAPQFEYPEGTFLGGPTGGVAEEQGLDPNFVTQSGVHDNK